MTRTTDGVTPPEIDSLWDYYEPAESEARFRALLGQARLDTAYHTELLTQIARAQGLQRDFEGAHRTLDSAKALVTPATARARVRYLLERGRIYHSSNDKDAAHPLFLQAWEHARAAGEDALAVDAAHMLAIVGTPEEQEAWNQKAVSAAEASDEPRARRWLGSLYNNLGWTFHDRGEYQVALDYFQKALAQRQTQADPREVRVARWCVGRVLRSLGKIEEAYQLQEALLQEYRDLEEEDGYVHEELGECLLRMGREDEARGYFARAYQELSQDRWLVDEEPERLARLRELGAV